MPVNSVSTATSTNLIDAPAGTNPNGILGKDDFLKLLLTELQYQDPTQPMDSEKILSQTSQLATLESAENTNKALDTLSVSLGNNLQFSTIASIGKMADLGSDKVALDKDNDVSFDMYFPTDVATGTIDITDKNGNVVQSIPLEASGEGVFNFTWNGNDSSGNRAAEGVYSVNASYADSAGNTQKTRIGAYPIESVRFDEGNTLVKLGGSYVPFENIKEIYER